MSAGQQARKQAMEGMNDQEKREYSEAQRKKQKDKNLNQKKDKQKWRKNRKDNSNNEQPNGRARYMKFPGKDDPPPI